jgi:uncharacterized protein
MVQPGPHPYFNDNRAAAWYTSLGEGLSAAREADRRVFVQIGRLPCGGSRALVEKVIPKEEIAEFLRDHFVCVGLSADDPDPAIAALVAGLPRREPTPLCVYLAPDGRPLHSTAGGRPAAVFLRDMTEALAKK